MRYSAQTDRFVHDRLPPPAQGPRLDYNLPELQLPAQVNLVQALFAGAARRGLADRPLLRSPRRTLSYAQAQLEVARIAQVLADCALDVGHRETAKGGLPLWIKGLQGLDQAEAADLHQVLHGHG